MPITCSVSSQNVTIAKPAFFPARVGRCRIIAVTLSILFLGVQLRAAVKEQIGSVQINGVQSFDCESLKFDETAGKPWHWLSIPGSRLTLNPYNGLKPASPLPLTPELGLTAAYFYGSQYEYFTNLVAVVTGTNDHPGKVSNVWYPQKLALTSQQPSESRRIEATDFFADENTIVRTLAFYADSNAPTTDGGPMIGGRVHGSPRILNRTTLLVAGKGYFYAVALAPLLKDGHQVSDSRLAIELSGERWSAQLSPLTTNHAGGAVIAVAFSTKDEGADVAVARVKRPLNQPAAQLLAARKKEWDRLLAAVPAPSRFGIRAVNAQGVTPEQHRLWYYGAWTFMLSQIMSPFPENNYPFYSIAEGKTSRWAYGEPGATPQCSWSTFMVISLISGVKPEIAWSAYEGVMSRVTEAGNLGGESLPSRKAQAAWILYSMTKDSKRLRQVYPAIKRYLIWREQNPRWIWEDADIPDEKDISFVASHLIDVDYAIRIAEVLKLNEDVAFWRQMTKHELENYRKWFFPKEGGPFNFYFANTGARTFKYRVVQEPCYILNGLGYRGMPKDVADRLLAFYDTVHDPAKPLVGFGFIKYGESSFIAYGLLDHGRMESAVQFMDAMLRDTIRSGEFGEEHVLQNGQAIMGGVSPSLFHSLQMIDFTLIRNGVRLDQGVPQFVPGANF